MLCYIPGSAKLIAKTTSILLIHKTTRVFKAVKTEYIDKHTTDRVGR